MCRENERTHKHHIIPRYMGGTDAVENLVEVTVTQHAMYHFCNYQLWGNEEDKIAWCALGGQISFDEARLEAMKLGGKKGNKAIIEKLKDPNNLEEFKLKCKESFKNSPHREKMIDRCKRDQAKAVDAAKTPEARKKLKQKLKEIGHQQGEKNSQYGTMWITNGTKDGTYRINRDELIPDGYWKGGICFKEPSSTKNASNFNKIWITNGITTTLIGKDELIPEGYYMGRGEKFNNKLNKEQCYNNGKYAYENKLGIHKQTKEEKIEYGSKGGKKSASQKWMCTETGYICNAGPLTRYQKSRGIDTSKRIKL